MTKIFECLNIFITLCPELHSYCDCGVGLSLNSQKCLTSNGRAKNALEMLVAPWILQCFGLPWSALVCYSLPWLLLAWSAASLADDGLATLHPPCIPLHPPYCTPMHSRASSRMACTPHASPCILTVSPLHSAASPLHPRDPPASLAHCCTIFL